MDHFDAVVIGAGPAGYTSALRLADFYKNVLLVDVSESRIGGTCLNEGCIPVKSLVKSAEVYRLIKKSGDYGIASEAGPLSLKEIRESFQRNIQQLRQGILLMLNNKKINREYGSASFLDKNSIEISHNGKVKTVSSDRFVIAAGSRVKEIPVFPTDGKTVLNSRDLLSMEKLPESILIIGGGAIGCEFASILNQLDVKVTIVEVLSQLLPSEDEDVARTLQREFQKKGIDVLTAAKVKTLKTEDSAVKAEIECDGTITVLHTQTALIAAGREPDTRALNLEKAGVKTVHGFIEVNHSLQTSVTNIYAAGDAVNSPAYAHTAYREGLIAAESMAGLKEGKAEINYLNIPRIVFSDPQVACVGLNEKGALEKGIPVKISKRFFKPNGKAVIEKKDAGFVKVITGAEDRILGASVIGASATELVHELGISIGAGIKADEIARFVHGHPTLSETIGETFALNH